MGSYNVKREAEHLLSLFLFLIGLKIKLFVWF